jgi:O-antigen ligase
MKKLLLTFDIVMLILMIVSLPSVEAPKNIFLVGYLIARLVTEIKEFRNGIWNWKSWDNIFLAIVFSALLSTLFAGFSGLEEWKGFKVLLTAILTGWLISRTNYNKEQYQLLFKLIILSTIPPLIWGGWEYLVTHSKKTLEIHSVGHVNHSAIYLAIIFGSCLAWFLSKFEKKEQSSAFKLSRIFLGFLSFIFFISLIIGQSRGAFLVGIFLGLCIFILLSKKKIIKVIGILTILSTVLFIFLLNTGIVQKQISYQENHNVLSYRDRVWNVSIEASHFHPLLGIGMSNWHFITLDQLKKSVESRGGTFNSDKYGFPGHAHNLYLSALVERGIIGLIVTLLFMFAWIKMLIKTFNWARKSHETIFLWGGAFSAWVVTFGVGLVNTTFHHEHAILACLLLGIYLSYARLYFEDN